MKTISILGSTGSIGQSTLDVIRLHKDKFNVNYLVAHSNAELIAAQAIEFNAAAVGIYNESKAELLKELLSGRNIKIYIGEDQICELASDTNDVVMSAIVGVAGLKPTLKAIENCEVLALANKESIVCGGKIFLDAIKKHNTQLLPVDSEHSALFQIFETQNFDKIKRVTLTASGGPFKHFSLEQMASVSPNQAIDHPTWKMGPKISTDCATLLNKGLEAIEAYHLFNLKPEQINVLVHYESIIHGMVHYADGSTLAHMGYPDMKTPIAYALSHPDRLEVLHRQLDLQDLGSLNFSAPDYKRFPMLKLALESLKSGLAAQIILNTSNEIAVDLFLNGKIKFLDIANIVENSLNNLNMPQLNNANDIFMFNEEVKSKAKEVI